MGIIKITIAFVVMGTWLVERGFGIDYLSKNKETQVKEQNEDDIGHRIFISNSSGVCSCGDLTFNQCGGTETKPFSSLICALEGISNTDSLSYSNYLAFQFLEEENFINKYDIEALSVSRGVQIMEEDFMFSFERLEPKCKMVIIVGGGDENILKISVPIKFEVSTNFTIRNLKILFSFDDMKQTLKGGLNFIYLRGSAEISLSSVSFEFLREIILTQQGYIISSSSEDSSRPKITIMSSLLLSNNPWISFVKQNSGMLSIIDCTILSEILSLGVARSDYLIEANNTLVNIKNSIIKATQRGGGLFFFNVRNDIIIEALNVKIMMSVEFDDWENFFIIRTGSENHINLLYPKMEIKEECCYTDSLRIIKFLEIGFNNLVNIISISLVKYSIENANSDLIVIFFDTGSKNNITLNSVSLDNPMGELLSYNVNLIVFRMINDNKIAIYDFKFEKSSNFSLIKDTNAKNNIYLYNITLLDVAFYDEVDTSIISITNDSTVIISQSSFTNTSNYKLIMGYESSLIIIFGCEFLNSFLFNEYFIFSYKNQLLIILSSTFSDYQTVPSSDQIPQRALSGLIFSIHHTDEHILNKIIMCDIELNSKYSKFEQLFNLESDKEILILKNVNFNLTIDYYSTKIFKANYFYGAKIFISDSVWKFFYSKEKDLYPERTVISTSENGLHKFYSWGLKLYLYEIYDFAPSITQLSITRTIFDSCLHNRYGIHVIDAYIYAPVYDMFAQPLNDLGYVILKDILFSAIQKLNKQGFIKNIVIFLMNITVNSIETILLSAGNSEVKIQIFDSSFTLSEQASSQNLFYADSYMLHDFSLVLVNSTVTGKIRKFDSVFVVNPLFDGQSVIMVLDSTFKIEQVYSEYLGSVSLKGGLFNNNHHINVSIINCKFDNSSITEDSLIYVMGKHTFFLNIRGSIFNRSPQILGNSNRGELHVEIFHCEFIEINSDSLLNVFISEFLNITITNCRVVAGNMNINLLFITPLINSLGNYFISLENSSILYPIYLINTRFKFYNLYANLVNNTMDQILDLLITRNCSNGTFQLEGNTFLINYYDFKRIAIFEIINEANKYYLTKNSLHLFNKTSDRSILASIFVLSGSGHTLIMNQTSFLGGLTDNLFYSEGCNSNVEISAEEYKSLKIAEFSDFITVFSNIADSCLMNIKISRTLIYLSSENFRNSFIGVYGKIRFNISLEKVVIKFNPDYRQSLLYGDINVSEESSIKIEYTTVKGKGFKNSENIKKIFENIQEELASALISIYSDSLQELLIKNSFISLGISKYNFLMHIPLTRKLLIYDSIFGTTVFLLSNPSNLYSGCLFKIKMGNKSRSDKSIFELDIRRNQFNSIGGGLGTIFNIKIFNESPSPYANETTINIAISLNTFYFIESQEQNPFIFMPSSEGGNHLKVNLEIEKNFFRKFRSSFGYLDQVKQSINKISSKLESKNFIVDDPGQNIVRYQIQSFMSQINIITPGALEKFYIYNEKSIQKDIYNDYRLTVNNNESSIGGRCILILAGFDYNSRLVRSKIFEYLNDSLINFNSNGTIEIYPATFDGFVCLEKIAFLKNNREGSNEFTIDLKKNDLLQYFSNYTTINQKDLRINFNFNLTCNKGNKLNIQNLICEPCPFGTFSNNDNLNDLVLECITCSSSDNFYCYGENYRSPKLGYYRYNSKSSRFLKCLKEEACLGDQSYKIKLDDNIFQGSVNLIKKGFDETFNEFTMIGACAKGYKGVLCAECEEGFGTVENHSCTPCDGLDVYFKQFVIILIKIVLFTYEIHKVFKDGKILKENKGILNMEMQNSSKSSYIIKILKDHLQILFILLLIPISIPKEVNYILPLLTISASPELERVFTFDCFVKTYFPNSRFTSNQLSLFIILIFDISVMLLYFLYYHFKINQRKVPLLMHFISTSRRIFFYIIMLNLVGQIQPYLLEFFCFEVSDPESNGLSDKRLMKDIKTSCYDDIQIAIKYYLCLPVVICLGLLLPLVFNISNLIKHFQGKFNHPDEIEKYGYFYIQYKKSYFFFDFLVYLKRVIMIFLQVLLTLSLVEKKIQLVNVLFLILIFCLSIYLTFVNLKPYNSHLEDLQTLEKISAITLTQTTTSFIVWVSQQSDSSNDGVKFSMLSLSLLSNTLFLAYIIYSFLKTKSHHFVKIKAMAKSAKNKLNLVFKKQNPNFQDLITDNQDDKEKNSKLTAEQQLNLAKIEINKLNLLVKLMSKQIQSLQSDSRNSSQQIPLLNPNDIELSSEEEKIEVNKVRESTLRSKNTQQKVKVDEIIQVSEPIVDSVAWSCEGTCLRNYFYKLNFRIKAAETLSLTQSLQSVFSFKLMKDRKDFVFIKANSTLLADNEYDYEIWLRPLYIKALHRISFSLIINYNDIKDATHSESLELKNSFLTGI